MPPIYDDGPPRVAIERQSGRLRPTRTGAHGSLNVTNPRTNEKLIGRTMPNPLMERDYTGGAQRPKVKDIGGGRVRVSGYHARDAGPTSLTRENLRPDEMMHIGTLRAARQRLSEVVPGNYDTSANTRVKPHQMYHVEVEMPRDEYLRRVGDLEANELTGAHAGRGASPMNASTRNIERATGQRLGAIGYANDYEDPGSISHAIRPSSVTKINRLYDAASTGTGLIALLGTAAQFIPGFAERMPRTNWVLNGGPMGDVLNYVINSNYAPGGIMDPYKDMRDLPGFNPATGTVPA